MLQLLRNAIGNSGVEQRQMHGNVGIFVDTVKSNIFANTAIRFVQRLPEARLLKSVVVPFEMERLDLI